MNPARMAIRLNPRPLIGVGTKDARSPLTIRPWPTPKPRAKRALNQVRRLPLMALSGHALAPVRPPAVTFRGLEALPISLACHLVLAPTEPSRMPWPVRRTRWRTQMAFLPPEDLVSEIPEGPVLGHPEDVEAGFLFIRQGRIEAAECGADDLYCLLHRLESPSNCIK